MNQNICRKGIHSIFNPADCLLGNIDLSSKIYLPQTFLMAQLSYPVIQCTSHPLVFYIYFILNNRKCYPNAMYRGTHI